jgi:hypothetical protein
LKPAWANSSQDPIWKTPNLKAGLEEWLNVESRIGEAYEDIRTVVLNILQAEIGTAPAAEEREKMRCSSADFPKMFMFRKAGVPLVTMTHPPLLENSCSTSLFTTGYKRLTEGCKAFG